MHARRHIGMVLMIAALTVIVTARAETRPDTWITETAQAALHDTKGLPQGLRVSTANGLVSLEGDVKTLEERSLAESAVRGVPGVVDVRNMLRVIATPAAPAKGPARKAPVAAPVKKAAPAPVVITELPPLPPAPASSVRTSVAPLVPPTVVDVEGTPILPPDDSALKDAQMRDAVIRALRDLDADAARDIQVEVRNGAVKLSGTVPTWQGNNDRLHAVRSVPGVTSVLNETRPLGPLSS